MDAGGVEREVHVALGVPAAPKRVGLAHGHVVRKRAARAKLGEPHDRHLQKRIALLVVEPRGNQEGGHQIHVLAKLGEVCLLVCSAEGAERVHNALQQHREALGHDEPVGVHPVTSVAHPAGQVLPRQRVGVVGGVDAGRLHPLGQHEPVARLRLRPPLLVDPKDEAQRAARQELQAVGNAKGVPPLVEREVGSPVQRVVLAQIWVPIGVELVSALRVAERDPLAKLPRNVVRLTNGQAHIVAMRHHVRARGGVCVRSFEIGASCRMTHVPSCQMAGMEYTHTHTVTRAHTHLHARTRALSQSAAPAPTPSPLHR